MKIRSSKRRSAAAHILLVTVFIAGCVGLVIAAYLNMIRSRNNLSARSQSWNGAMALVEAGLEEGLAHLNLQGGSNLAVNGWTSITNSVYTKRRDLDDGYYVATMTVTNPSTPKIVCTGYKPVPLTLTANQDYLFAAAGGGVSTTQYLSRTVQLLLSRQPLFTKAIVTKDSVDLGGNKCIVDSYDSSKGDYDPKNPGDKGDVGCNGDMRGAVSTGNGDIRGNLHVGPKATVDTGPNSIIGDNAWFASGKKGIQSGHLKKDANFYLPDVTPPWSWGAGGAFPLGSPNAVFSVGRYEANNLNVANNQTMHINGDVVVYVKGNVDIKGTLKITAGSLTLYVDGNRVDISGNVTKTTIPSDLMIFGFPSLKTLSLDGLHAVVYAPDANMELKGSAQFYGSTVSKTLTLNGSTGYHYDESLSALPNIQGYVVTSWTEI
jgi:hypothetical protein